MGIWFGSTDGLKRLREFGFKNRTLYYVKCRPNCS